MNNTDPSYDCTSIHQHVSTPAGKVHRIYTHMYTVVVVTVVVAVVVVIVVVVVGAKVELI